MTKMNDVQKIMDLYCQVVEDGLQERWEKIPLELYNSETFEAIGGLLSRQATLTIFLAISPTIWNGHIAPLFLRCMTDAHITLAWILKEPNERAKQYILYGLGQEKLQIEHLELEKKNGDEDHQLDELIQAKRDWLNSQRIDYLTEVDVGNWSGKNTRTMSQEAGCESLYKFSYTPFSGVAHNMWQHISRYNLRQCVNPLHKFHQVPEVIDVPVDPDYVYRSAKYITRSYEEADKKYNLKINTMLPLKFFEKKFKELEKKKNEKQ